MTSYRQDDTKQPPESGPTTLVEKIVAHFIEVCRIVDANTRKIGGLACLFLLAWMATETRSCSKRWSAESEDQCRASCLMSGDVAYQAELNCMCLTADGDRYRPYQPREVCND